MLKRVLIIHSEGNSFGNPSLKCIIDLLLKKGCEIDLRYPQSGALMPTGYADVRFLPFGIRLKSWKYRVFNQSCSWFWAFLLVLVEKLVFYKKYDLIIGIDREGLIEANMLNKITRTPYVLISFEIMFEDETSLKFKSLERDASKNLAAWIIQDEVRAGHLQRESFLDPAKKILLPVASAGVGVAKNDRLRDSLNIPLDKKVAIVIGSVSKWAMTNQIIRSVVFWPEEWVLVVHDRYGRTRQLLAGELADFSGLLDGKIFISDAATELVDDMGGILAGISVGLALYQPEHGGSRYEGKNLAYLGLSSGKISTYLRYGIPVIINEVGLYAEEVRKFRFGRVVQGAEQISDCLDEISHEEYRHNAEEYFANKLDFNNYQDEIWHRLESLVA